MTVSGKNINLRTVTENDAGFVFTLRQDIKKTQHLSKITGTVQDQIDWIKEYKKRELLGSEYYFIIESKKNEPLGLVRMYDFKGKSFCWGSWLIKDGAPKSTAIESAIQIYEFAFYKRKFTQSHFEVQKGNDKVIAFHKRFGAEVVDENEDEYFFIISKAIYEKTKQRYKRYI